MKSVSHDDIISATRELLDALDGLKSGMPIESDEAPIDWFRAAEERVRTARKRCRCLVDGVPS